MSTYNRLSYDTIAHFLYLSERSNQSIVELLNRSHNLWRRRRRRRPAATLHDHLLMMIIFDFRQSGRSSDSSLVSFPSEIARRQPPLRHTRKSSSFLLPYARRTGRADGIKWDRIVGKQPNIKSMLNANWKETSNGTDFTPIFNFTIAKNTLSPLCTRWTIPMDHSNDTPIAN